MDLREIATKIYDDSIDMDFADYEDTKDIEVSAIEKDLEELYKNDSVLFWALERIYNKED